MLPYLTLNFIQLGASESWSSMTGGVTFVICKSGRGTLRHVSLLRHFRPGDVFVLSGERKLEFFAWKASPLAFGTFRLSLEHLSPLFAAHELGLLENLEEAFHAGVFYAAGTDIARECVAILREIPSRVDLAHRSHLVRLAAVVLTEELEQVQRKRTGAAGMAPRINRVLAELSTGSLVTLSVTELANKLACSPRHLNRIFHQYFGLSAAQMKMELRLHRALTLLRNPNTKIIWVAQQSGFNHLRLFNASFKRRFGRSPSQWRKLNATREGETTGGLEARSNGKAFGSDVYPWLPQPGAIPFRREPSEQPSNAKLLRAREWASQESGVMAGTG